MKFHKFSYRLLQPADDVTGLQDGNSTGLPAGEDVVGTGNEARLALLNQIADGSEREREEELAEVNDDGTTTPFVAPTVGGEDEPTTAEASAPAPAPAPAPTDEFAEFDPDKKYKLKVNGEEIVLTGDEMRERLQKITAADKYLQEAAELKKSAALSTAPAVAAPVAPTGPTAEELRRRDEEEDLKLARAIQMGTEEEAVTALRRIREKSVSATPPLSRDDIARTFDERLAFNNAIEKFSTEYGDVWGDPVLKGLALQRDDALVKGGDARPYYERYASIGDEIRAWKDSIAPAAAPKATTSAVPLTEKETRKALVPAVPTSASGKTKPVPAEEEIDDNPQSVIANMAKVRGGPQWMRN